MKKEEFKTLGDKMICNLSAYSEGRRYTLLAVDVKEFIKKLKEETLGVVNKEIDKLAGKELI